MNPDYTKLAKSSLVHGIVAHQGSGVSQGGTGAQLATADFESYNRFTLFAGLGGHSPQLFRAADAFQKERDNFGSLVFQQVVNDVGDRKHAFVAHRDEQAQADSVSLGKSQHRAG